MFKHITRTLSTDAIKVLTDNGVSPECIDQWKEGQRLPTLPQARLLAHVAGVDFHELADELAELESTPEEQTFCRRASALRTARVREVHEPGAQRHQVSSTTSIAIRQGSAPDLEAYLEERIYEYNAATTGYHDAELFNAAQVGDSGEINAGVCGYTWGRCCYVSYLWVAEAARRKGLGTELLNAVEGHARGKCCSLILLSSHSFQAPDFYSRNGYKPVARVDDHPVGHSDIFYAKPLDAT